MMHSGDYAWERNPLVTVYTFRRVRP